MIVYVNKHTHIKKHPSKNMISQSCSRFCILPKSPRSIAFNPLRIQRSYFILLRRRLVVVSWPPGFAETIHLKHGKRRLLFEVHDSTMHK